ncbi:MAG TPA: glycosyltransferase, partial [Chitinophagaceae bacterium]
MKIALIARNTLYSARGGDTVQIVNTAGCLSKLGISADIKLTNESIDYASYDLLHFFNICRPADILYHVSQSSTPFVVSPNLVDYSEYDKYHRRGLTGFLLSFLSMNSAEYIKTVARWVLGKDKLVSKSYLWKGHRRSIREILNRVALVLPGSMLEYERLIALYKVNPPFQLVPNGVNTSLFAHSHTVQKEEDIVLCAARIEGIKNQVNLIKALNNTRYKVIIAGSPAPNQPGYYRQCRKIAAGNIFFVDHLPQEELLSYYQKAKVHILPSWFETCGLSTLEAGMAGCNVVITNKGYTYEYFADHAFYCDPSSPDSIRKAVDKAFMKSESGQLRERISSLYTWPLAAGSTFNAYKKAIGMNKKLRIGILGTRGIPNHYGGFEQFAEHISAGLVKEGHEVTVYNSHRHPYRLTNWKGVQIVHRYDPEYMIGTAGQFVYDLNCILDARKRGFDITLMLGYTSSSLWGWLFPKKT